MKIVKKKDREKHENSKNCTAFEYPLGDKDINGAVAKITGRYPDKGSVVNEVCKEIAYVIEGSGKVVVEGKEVKLNKGDLILIEPREKYYWEGNMEMFMPCTPAWYIEQHKEID